MKYKKLGISDIDVSVLSMGTWQLGDTDYWGTSEYGADAVRAAIDAGINLFDTAEAYGNGESEAALSKALGNDRDKILIATKVRRKHCAPEKIRQACEDSLQRLRTDHIDIYQVHWPSHGISFAETFEELIKLKKEGKIRKIGLCNFGKNDLDEWMSTGDAISNQLGYNLLFRAVEYEILPACKKYKLGVLVYMPLMQGILAGKWKSIDEIPAPRRRTRHFSSEREGVRHKEKGCEVLTWKALMQLSEVANEIGGSLANLAIAWLLTRSEISSIIIGGRKPDQIERNVGSIELNLEPEIVARINRITEPLKKSLGINADMWESQVNSRIK